MSQTSSTLLDSTHSHPEDDFYFELPDEAIYPFEKSGKPSTSRIRRSSRVINRTDLEQAKADNASAETEKLVEAKSETIVLENQEQACRSKGEEFSKAPLDNQKQDEIDNTVSITGELFDGQDIDDLCTIDKNLAEALKVKENFYDGRIYYVKGNYHRYKEDQGIWVVDEHEDVIQDLTVDYYHYSLAIPKVKAVVESLRVTTRTKTSPPRNNDVAVLKNCAVNLMTGERLGYNPDYYARNRLNFDYDANAKCPTWLAFLGSIFGQEPDFQERVYLLQGKRSIFSIIPNPHQS